MPRSRRSPPRRPAPWLEAARKADVRRRPDLYRVGRGEEGVLTFEPYKSELLPLWRFATPAMARRSSRALLRRFRSYQEANDFVGMDMARKFLQMGWTRARRYANRPGGRKYASDGSLLPRHEDPVKAESARIFHKAYAKARDDPHYRRMRAEHRGRQGE